MTRVNQLATIVVASLLLIAGAAAPAAANPIGDVFSDEDEDDGLLPDVDAIVAAATGVSDRVSAWASRTVNGPPDPESKATATAETFNNNSAEIVGYVNSRATVDSSHEVAEITFVLGDREATRYVVGEVNSTTGNYTSAAMLTRSEYEARGLGDSDVDETIELSGYAAENAPDELDTFITEYVGPDKDISGSKDEARMKTSYAGGVSASFDF